MTVLYLTPVSEPAAMQAQTHEEWPEERIQALVTRYEETDQLALDEALNQMSEWD